MTKTILLSVISLGTCAALTACGGGGGGGGGGSIDAQKAFSDDMKALSGTKVTSEKVANAEIPDSYTKVFGSASPAAVKSFIQARVKHVYAYDQLENFQVEFTSNGKTLGAGTIAQWSGGLGKNYGATRGVNYSSIAGNHMANPNVNVTVFTPNGPVNAQSYRVGLVGLTPGYANMEVYNVSTKTTMQMPTLLEDRISVLVHEGRHSDCHDTSQIGNPNPTNCGYGHAKCLSGPLAGAEACESVPWGAYGIQLVYMLAIQNNYAFGTDGYRYIDQMIDDLRSRFAQSPQTLATMKASDPQLD